jgi:hypothetical protein
MVKEGGFTPFSLNKNENKESSELPIPPPGGGRPGGGDNREIKFSR